MMWFCYLLIICLFCKWINCLVCFIMVGLWVEIRKVMLCFLFNWYIKFMSVLFVLELMFVVGLFVRMRVGFVVMVLVMVIFCCCFLESWLGKWFFMLLSLICLKRFWIWEWCFCVDLFCSMRMYFVFLIVVIIGIRL